MKTYFAYRESTIGNGWVIAPNLKEFMDVDNPTMIRGSFNLLACRISGLSWPQWLRYCRQHGAHLYGKNCKYVVAVWEEPNKEFLRELNVRANEIAKLIDLKQLSL